MNAPNRWLRANHRPSGPCKSKKANGDLCGQPTVQVAGVPLPTGTRPADHGPAELTICQTCDALGPPPLRA